MGNNNNILIGSHNTYINTIRHAHYAIPDKRGDKAGITEIQLKCCEVKQ